VEVNGRTCLVAVSAVALAAWGFIATPARAEVTQVSATGFTADFRET
jgi:hypothetical protein